MFVSRIYEKDNKKILYEIRIKINRKISYKILNKTQLIVYKSYDRSLFEVENYLSEKFDELYEELKYKQIAVLNLPILKYTFDEGEEYTFLGTSYIVEHIKKEQFGVKLLPPNTLQIQQNTKGYKPYFIAWFNEYLLNTISLHVSLLKNKLSAFITNIPQFKIRVMSASWYSIPIGRKYIYLNTYIYRANVGLIDLIITKSLLDYKGITGDEYTKLLSKIIPDYIEREEALRTLYY